MSAAPARRAYWLLATTSAAAFVCWSEVALAGCVDTPAGGVQAVAGPPCEVSGTFATTLPDAIAGEATGVGALLTGPVDGPITFSTTGASANALQADSGGNINLTPTVAAPGTVETTGAGSFGLFATGSGEGEEGASHINALNLDVSTTGPNAFGAVANNGAFVSLTGGSVMVSGDGSIGVNSVGAGSTVQASGVAVKTTGEIDSDTGNTAVGLVAFDGGTITFAGGSITTTGVSADAVASDGSGSSITLNGGTTILTMNNGSAGLVVVGSGAAAMATGIGITTHGNEDTSDGFIAAGAYNGQDAGGAFPNGGTMQLTNTVILTTGSNAPGVETNSGGMTTISGGSVMTTGVGSVGILATGSAETEGGSVASHIALQNVTVSTSGPAVAGGPTANGIEVGNGATANITGGSVTTTPTANGAVGVTAAGGAQVMISGTTINSNGNGSQGLFVTGAGSSLTGDMLNITASGDNDPITGFNPGGASNNGFDEEFPTGGALSISNSTLTTTGTQSFGVFTADGGTTTLNNDTITTKGNDAFAGVESARGGQTTISGGSVTTSGLGSPALLASGAGSSITATGVAVATSGNFDPSTKSSSNGLDVGEGARAVFSGGSISTAGNGAYAVVAESKGSISLSGTTISTTGNGSGGLGINGSGSEIDAAGVTIATTGAMDPVTGLHSYGVYNGPFGEFASGGVAKIIDTTISTQGAAMFGILTGAGASTTLTDTKVSTAGLGAFGMFTDAGGVTNISGGSVNTSGQGAHALFVTGTGSQANVAGAGTFATTGAGAIGLYATLGGAISATGSATTSIATAGGVSSATSLGAYGINADGAGSLIKLGSATVTTSGAGATGLFVSDRASSGAGGTITASGTLNVQTKNPSAAAVALQGDGAMITATGGGTITAAGNAIAFMGGTGQSATFDGFSIGNLSGDLVFADPSIATLNFNNTTANAGNNNLLNATAGSAFTLNASASTLTGAIRTDATSTSTVNLTNGATWNLTAPSTVTNLNVTHSIIVFAPPGAGGAFKTLTVNNYAGNGANITMNVALSGSGSSGDQIIINGGKATGSTLLTINNVGGLGGQTSGNGIPLVLAKNGGTVSPDAFALANTPMAGGFKYTLEETDNSFFLVSSPTATVGGITNSINNVAKAQQSQMITNRVLSSILLGATQQVSCSSCGGGFASVGSFALGGSGRWSLSDTTTLIGGISYNQWSASGITVYNAPTVAGALVYDFVKWGSSRPFLEVGAGLTPYEQVNTTRIYPNGLSSGFGYSTATDREASLFGRAGWVDRLTPIDEAAAYVDLGRSWMQTGGSSEQLTAINPFPATVPSGLAALNVARLGTQYTHLFNGNIEVNVSAAVAYGFGAGAGAPFNVFEFGTIAPGAIADSAWFEYGARVGYRVTDRLVVDGFLLGTAGGLAGNFVHGGVGVRYSF
jgi:Autochaperone Domain Type 1